MDISFGEHSGKSTEEVLLTHASFAKLVLEGAEDAALRNDLRVLIEKFDAKPFSKTCFDCGAPATTVSAYRATKQSCSPGVIAAITTRKARTRRSSTNSEPSRREALPWSIFPETAKRFAVQLT